MYFLDFNNGFIYLVWPLALHAEELQSGVVCSGEHGKSDIY